MEEITVPKYILEQMKDGLRLAANILESRNRETAADRQIEYAERLANWSLGDRSMSIPEWLPNKEK